MPYDVAFNEAHSIVEICYSGAVTAEELLCAYFDAVSLAKSVNSKRFLADCTALRGGHSLTDLYLLIDQFEASGLERDVKEAILIPSLQASVADVEFYETACRNRGYNISLFRDLGAALAWLRG